MVFLIQNYLKKVSTNYVRVITDRVRSTRREVIVSLCLLVHTCRGGTPASPSQPMRGYPDRGVPHLRYPSSQTWLGGILIGGTPPWVPPPPCQTWLEGYPTSGTPNQTCLGGTPPQVPHQTWPRGTLMGGTPPQVPPILPGQGGTPMGGTPPRVTDGVLDTPRSVCLLRSRRRTFLFHLQTT